MADLLVMTDAGLHCPAGGFHIDPSRPVARAVLTHAHGDHARAGSASYLVSASGAPLFRRRLGAEASLQTLAYGEVLTVNGVRLSLHPAGHVPGSAQIRLEAVADAVGAAGAVGSADRRVWVVTGDFKREPDPTCDSFEPVPCDALVMESTFALPVYRWPSAEEVAAEILAWWRGNALGTDASPRASLLLAYALGKAQRILKMLEGRDLPGPVYAHGAIAAMNEAYAEAGVSLPPTRDLLQEKDKRAIARSLVVAPPSAHGTTWTRRLGRHATGAASGWMRVRGHRRRRAVDAGFVLSDHADWPGLLDTMRESGAAHVRVMHGYAAILARHLTETYGLDAVAWGAERTADNTERDDAEAGRSVRSEWDDES